MTGPWDRLIAESAERCVAMQLAATIKEIGAKKERSALRGLIRRGWRVDEIAAFLPAVERMKQGSA